MDNEKNRTLLDLYKTVADAARDYLGDDEPPQEDAKDIEETALTEIDADKLKEYLTQATSACRSFDADTAARIAEETSGYAFDGVPLKDHFGKAAQLAADFEYEAAEQELGRLAQKLR